MHDYKDYKMTYNNGNTDIYRCCCKCGSVEVKNPDRTHLVCSGKMHENSTVRQLNMKLVE